MMHGESTNRATFTRMATSSLFDSQEEKKELPEFVFSTLKDILRSELMSHSHISFELRYSSFFIS